MIRLEGFGGINWTQLRDFPAKKTVQFSLSHAISIIVAFMVQFFRFIWLPSTKNRKVFKVSNEDPVIGPNSGLGNIDPINGLVNDDAMDMEKDQEALRHFFNGNNNGRHIK